jgi:hypothetical protein
LPGERSREDFEILELGNFGIEVLRIFFQFQNFPIVLSKISYYALASAAFTTGFLVLVALAGLDLPNEPWNLFPFAVFLSPLPMICFLRMKSKDTKIKKPRILGGVEFVLARI